MQPEWDRWKGQRAKSETALLPFTRPPIPSCTHWGDKLLETTQFMHSAALWRKEALYRENVWKSTVTFYWRAVNQPLELPLSTHLDTSSFQHCCGHSYSFDTYVT